jgi:hypothetical protein
VPVSLTYNPSYSEGRGHEDYSSKPVLANSLEDPISRKTHHTNKACGVAQGVGPEFKPKYQKTNKQKTMRLGSPVEQLYIQTEKNNF